MIPLERLLDKLDKVRQSGIGFTALCPAHDDHNPSLSVRQGDDGKMLVKCHAGCPTKQVLGLLGLQMSDLFRADGNGGRGRDTKLKMHTDHPAARPLSPKSMTTSAAVDEPMIAAQAAGLTVERFGILKGLPVDFLREKGLSNFHYGGKPAVRFSYSNELGQEVSSRFRTEHSYYWRRGSKVIPLGLSDLPSARALGHIVIVEGESDFLTLQYHGIPSLGLPGASTWKEYWSEYLEGIPDIYLVIEPDQGDLALKHSFAESKIRDRIRLVGLGEHKDPNELYLADRKNFESNFHMALEASVPLIEDIAEEERRRTAGAEGMCRPRGQSPHSRPGH